MIQREVSETPLQTLSLLNDPMMVELYDAFGADLAARATQAEVDDVLTHAFVRACTRAPDAQELQTLREKHSTAADFDKTRVESKIFYKLTGEKPTAYS